MSPGFAISLASLRDFITEEEFTLSVGEFQDIIRDHPEDMRLLP